MDVDRSQYTRVTDVLSPFSGLSSINKEVLDNAAKRGTAVHNACNCVIEDLPYTLDLPERAMQEAIQFIASFKLWHDPERSYFFPERFYCDELQLTGECDFLYSNGTGFTLVDLKTPASESKNWLLQGSAYSHLAKKAGYNITRIEFIRLSKTGKAPKVHVYEENFPLYEAHLISYNYSFKKPTAPREWDYL